MAHISYTASERRGVLLIALISLIIVAAGIGVTLFGTTKTEAEIVPVVNEYPQLIDSLELKKQQKKEDNKNRNKKKKSTNSKEKKRYRQRNPLDEPV
ncbi:MAG: hypothetical protein J1F16_04875 [Muribaculaceae bacterium]|nr:hypothetical protein [Muribaculaceae bacterium]